MSTEGGLKTREGELVAYRVLALEMHLEVGELFEETLREATSFLLEAIGGELRWYELSMFQEPLPFEARALDWINAYPSRLRAAVDLSDEDAEQLLAQYETYGIELHGGEGGRDASPWSIDFWTEYTEVAAEGVPTLCAVLRVTVPIDFDANTVAEWSRRIVSGLPLRWASLGYSYTGRYGHPNYRRPVYAHARRHCGYDAGDYYGWLGTWYTCLRSVNWITILGPVFRSALKKLPKAPVRTEAWGAATAIIATDQPMEGDTNRLDIPQGYIAVDKALRSLRVTPQGGSFAEPWTATTTTDWIRRFELAVN